MPPYKFAVNFTKRFVEGNLAGITVRESLPFATRSDAVFYAKQEGYLVTTFAGGGGAYRIEDAQVVDL